MDREEYRKKALEVDKLVQSGRYDEAIVLLRGLINSDLGDQDKAMMYVNIATIYDKMKMPRQAIGAYDQGIRFESSYNGHWILWKKAAYLEEIGENEESIKVLGSLLTNSRLKLTDQDKAVASVNIAIIYDKMNMPQQAIGAYDQGIRFESIYKGYWALWQKAAYLAKTGEKEGSITAFEGLLKNDTLKPDERAAIESNIATLKVT